MSKKISKKFQFFFIKHQYFGSLITFERKGLAGQIFHQTKAQNLSFSESSPELKLLNQNPLKKIFQKFFVKKISKKISKKSISTKNFQKNGGQNFLKFFFEWVLIE